MCVPYGRAMFHPGRPLILLLSGSFFEILNLLLSIWSCPSHVSQVHIWISGNGSSNWSLAFSLFANCNVNTLPLSQNFHATHVLSIDCVFVALFCFWIQSEIIFFYLGDGAWKWCSEERKWCKKRREKRVWENDNSISSHICDKKITTH